MITGGDRQPTQNQENCHQRPGGTGEPHGQPVNRVDDQAGEVDGNEKDDVGLDVWVGLRSDMIFSVTLLGGPARVRKLRCRAAGK